MIVQQSYSSALIFSLGAAVSGASLWGGRKILQQAYKPESLFSTDKPQDKTALKVAGYAFITFGVLAGIVASVSLSFVFVPFALSSLFSSASILTINIASAITFIASCAGLGYATYRACLEPQSS